MTRYFLAVDSRDHVLTGVSTRLCSAGSGRSALFAQMAEGDWLVYYSPKELHRQRTPCRRFTAIGKVEKGGISSPGGSEGLSGPRRPFRYLRCYPLPAAALVRSLSFVRDKKRWEPSLRRGLVELKREDFDVIAQAMLTRVDWETL
jgi:hypothetical protein